MVAYSSHSTQNERATLVRVDVTLAIPTYNSAAFLEDLFASLAKLTILPREILIHDDASTDGSFSLAERLRQRYALATDVRVLGSERNLGVAGAYNRLAREASSSWLHILDADDSLCGDFYRGMASLLADPRLGMIVGAARSTHPVVNSVYRCFSASGLGALPRWLPVLGLFTTRSSIVYRTKLVREAPFPDPAYDGSDIVHYIGLRRHAPARFVAQSVVCYRIHPGAVTRRASVAPYRAALRQLRPGPLYWLDFIVRKHLFAFLRK